MASILVSQSILSGGSHTKLTVALWKGLHGEQRSPVNGQNQLAVFSVSHRGSGFSRAKLSL